MHATKERENEMKKSKAGRSGGEIVRDASAASKRTRVSLCTSAACGTQGEAAVCKSRAGGEEDAAGPRRLSHASGGMERDGCKDQTADGGVITLDDVEDLNRRRQQLSGDVETSLARIAELELWIRKANAISGGGDGVDAEFASLKHQQDAVQRLTAARAMLSAVHAGHWQNLRSLRRPSLAITTILQVALSMLGKRSLTSPQPELWEQVRGMKNLPRSLIKLEPSELRDEVVDALRRSQFGMTWTYNRVVRVHPTTGPLHKWITAMLKAKAAISNSAQAKMEKDTPYKFTAEALDVAALMRELDEHAEYVQLARDELAAIDSILKDMVCEAVERSTSVFTQSPSLDTCSDSTIAPSDVTRQLSKAESLGPNAAAAPAAVAIDVASVHKHKEQQPQQQQQQQGVVAVMQDSSSTEGMPPVVPKLCLGSCSMGGEGANTSARSLRVRLDNLLASPRARSPRLGRSIILPGPQSSADLNWGVPTGSIGSIAPCSSARVLQERADLLQRVYELEDMLKEACHRNPKTAEMQLMRDEMMAARRELMALREERNQLLEQNKRYSVYYKVVDVERRDGDQESCAGGADSLVIRDLEEQLQVAHADIQQLKATCARCPSSSILDEGELATETRNESAAANSCGDLVLQKRLDESKQQLEAQQASLAAMEERLNQEMHAHKEARERLREMQAELTSVWKRLESVEYQLKLAHEEMGGITGSDASLSGSMPRGMLGGDTALKRELQQYRQRELENQQMIERLRMEVDTLKRRHMEERQRQKEIRTARTELLLRLEKTFGEALRRQECDLQAIPAALTRARSEMERLGCQRS